MQSGGNLAEAARRPHGQHTTVVVHVDVKDKYSGVIVLKSPVYSGPSAACANTVYASSQSPNW